tara:strand:- start:38 stop:979 length:942 start_codon:yes stop_codon:yes gene_type:complete
MEQEKKYFRLMLGKGSVDAEECLKNNYIGIDFSVYYNIENDLVENWRDFNKKFIPIFLENHVGASKIKAGLACGALWTFSKGASIGDFLLCPDGTGTYRVAEITGNYFYTEGETRMHRREVKWLDTSIKREEMSDALKNSTGATSTLINISKYSSEIESLLNNESIPKITTSDPEIEDPASFALERHLEDFLVTNWDQTELAKSYDIYEDDENNTGQQFPTDTGPIDILAVSKDRKELLVIELKKGRASDSVVGQIQRYMGYIKDELLEEDQSVRGIIIALDEDKRIKRALSIANNISFYRYRINFELTKSNE